MKQEGKAHKPSDLERVIARNQEHLTRASGELRSALDEAGIPRDVPEAVVRNALKLYQDMRSRLNEIALVQKLLAERHGKPLPRDPKREQLARDLDSHIQRLCERLEQAGAAGATDCAKAAAGLEARSPAERWLKTDSEKVAFTRSARLLDELEHPKGLPDKADTRRSDRAGRGFTLFSIRGDAAAIDALVPEIKLREHDVVERYSAYEIRGVLTHLRRTTLAEVSTVFQRLLKTRFPEVKCILIELRSPDELNEEVLDTLERTAGGMRPGAMQIIDLTE